MTKKSFNITVRQLERMAQYATDYIQRMPDITCEERIMQKIFLRIHSNAASTLFPDKHHVTITIEEDNV